MINSHEIILEKQKQFFAKNHCEIQVRIILDKIWHVCKDMSEGL